MIPVTYNIPTQLKNDTFNGVQFTLTNKTTGDPIDLTGSSIEIEFKFKSKTGTIAKSISVGSGITVSAPATGVFAIDAFVIDWAIGTYYYDVEITDTSAVVSTYIKGTLLVNQDVTNG
jgi:hypothetical protein